jgi:opacity protein-like surface antigen
MNKEYSMKHKIKKIGCTALLLVLSGVMAQAGQDGKMMEAKPEKIEKIPSITSDWSIELGSGVEFSNVRAKHYDGSTQIPVKLGLVLKVDEVSNDDFLGGIFRGNTEFVFTGAARFLSGAQENSIYSFQVGPRYNFVQEGWKLIPFIEGGVGMAFADSNSRFRNGAGDNSGLGQDFNFMFSVIMGAKYDFTDRFYGKLGLRYTHFSNAGLSEPSHQNESIDAAGPEVGIGYHF